MAKSCTCLSADDLKLLFKSFFLEWDQLFQSRVEKLELKQNLILRLLLPNKQTEVEDEPVGYVDMPKFVSIEDFDDHEKRLSANIRYCALLRKTIRKCGTSSFQLKTIFEPVVLTEFNFTGQNGKRAFGKTLFFRNIYKRNPNTS